YNSHSAKPVGDLAFLAPCTKMTRLYMADSDFTNLGAIATMKELRDLDVSGAKNPVDLTVVKSLPNLSELNLQRAEVTNFEALLGHPKLERLNISKTTGIASIKGLVANTALRQLTVQKDAFPEADLLAVSNALSTVKRSFRIYSYK
ncbi:MAG: hypothetical protein MJ240_13605, partial [Kiritimatiellae bacterium]|nr:hypothetical protein [Kiritimatiellia bacterium]